MGTGYWQGARLRFLKTGPFERVGGNELVPSEVHIAAPLMHLDRSRFEGDGACVRL